jgi:hypothetical protein
VPLSKIQIDVLRLLAAHRDPESYVAGATPLNRDAPRYSSDIDVFHDRQERVASAALSDAQALGVAGYAVRWLRQLPQMYTAEDRPIRVGRKSRQRCLGLDRNIALQFRPAVEVI